MSDGWLTAFESSLRITSQY